MIIIKMQKIGFIFGLMLFLITIKMSLAYQIIDNTIIEND